MTSRVDMSVRAVCEATLRKAEHAGLERVVTTVPRNACLTAALLLRELTPAEALAFLAAVASRVASVHAEETPKPKKKVA